MSTLRFFFGAVFWWLALLFDEASYALWLVAEWFGEEFNDE